MTESERERERETERDYAPQKERKERKRERSRERERQTERDTRDSSLYLPLSRPADKTAQNSYCLHHLTLARIPELAPKPLATPNEYFLLPFPLALAKERKTMSIVLAS